MQIRKTSAVVESGILAAIAVIFTLVGNYIPVLDMIVNILWPLPIILCGRRNGLKWSISCLVVTGCVVAVLLSPLQALTQCLILGLIGLMMGWAMRRQMSPGQTLLMGSLGAFISTVLSVLAAYVFMHINVVEVFFQSVDESLQLSNQMFETLGMSGMTAVQAAQVRQLFELVLPAGVLLSAPVTALANYWAARKILARMGDYYPWFPPFFPVGHSQIDPAALWGRTGADCPAPECPGFLALPGRLHVVYDGQYVPAAAGAVPDPLVCGIPALSPFPAAAGPGTDLYHAGGLPVCGGFGRL